MSLELQLQNQSAQSPKGSPPSTVPDGTLLMMVGNKPDIITSANIAKLPTADPHVAGCLFRTGTALNISVG